MTNRHLAAAVAAVVASASAAHAQQTGWEFIATGYLWLPTSTVTVDTPRGSLTGELSVADALDALKFAAMGNIEARKGKVGLVADLLYFNLGQSRETPFGALFARGTVDTELTALTLAAFYRLHDADGVTLDIGAGLRAIDSDSTVTLSGGPLPNESFRQQDDWVDPIVALRARFDLTEKWFGTLYLDAGGTGSSSTAQAGLGVGYRVNERLSLQGGWRYLDIERDENGQSLDMTQSGVIFGLSYKF